MEKRKRTTKHNYN